MRPLKLYWQHFIFFVRMNGPNKLECYFRLSWKGLQGTNAHAYWALLLVKKKMKVYEYDSRSHIHNTSFSLYLINAPNKLECYIRVSWKGLPGTNTLAYRALLLATKKMKCCEYGPWSHIDNTSFYLQPMVGSNKLECYIILSWKCLPGTNTLAYRALLLDKKKMKCCEYGPWSHIDNTSFYLQPTNVPNKLEC
jgi:hypothetical protein